MQQAASRTFYTRHAKSGTVSLNMCALRKDWRKATQKQNDRMQSGDADDAATVAVRKLTGCVMVNSHEAHSRVVTRLGVVNVENTLECRLRVCSNTHHNRQRLQAPTLA
jgi:hypothetical protein